MRKLSVKDIAIMGFCLALMVVAGRVLYIASNLLPIPSSRVLVTTPVFAFILTAGVSYTRKMGTISLICIAYGLYLMKYSFFSFLAVALSGVLCELTAWILFRDYKRESAIVWSVPLKSVYSVWTSFFVVRFFVPGSRFIQYGIIPLLIISFIIYGVGYVCSRYCLYMMKSRALIL